MWHSLNDAWVLQQLGSEAGKRCGAIGFLFFEEELLVASDCMSRFGEEVEGEPVEVALDQLVGGYCAGPTGSIQSLACLRVSLDIIQAMPAPFRLVVQRRHVLKSLKFSEKDSIPPPLCALGAVFDTDFRMMWQAPNVADDGCVVLA